MAETLPTDEQREAAQHVIEWFKTAAFVALGMSLGAVYGIYGGWWTVGAFLLMSVASFVAAVRLTNRWAKP